MKKRAWLIVSCLFLTIFQSTAQCVMCTKTASELDNDAATGLNGGIIYLAFLPLLLIGTIGYIWWKHNRNVGG